MVGNVPLHNGTLPTILFSLFEILSPKQDTYDILEKFKAYFALGITSCWLVAPALRTVTVYASNEE